MINQIKSNSKSNFSHLNLFLLLSGLVSVSTNSARIISDIDDIFAEFHKDILHMEERMLNSFKTLDATESKVNLARMSADIKEDGDYVVISLTLPNKIGDNSVTIEAKQNSLKGSVATDDCKTKFNIANNGQTFSYSCSSTRDEKSDQGDRYFASETYRQVTLPVAVTELENAQIERKEQNLVLRLPKAKHVSASTGEWKKLAVK
ncbi:MAG TPA: hypothetical protein VJJ81_02705 [Candidatus Babeliales bacterium]|nr:hypothetical protein [Candidatus Babeliales bacterium]